MSFTKHMVGLLWALLIIQGCDFGASQKENSSVLKEHHISGNAQGTTYTVKYIGEEKYFLKEKLDSLLRSIDESMSTYVPNSLISRLNQEDSIQPDDMFLEVFEESKQISKLSAGAFDPTIAPLIEAWGFDFSDPKKIDSNVVNELLKYCGFEQFELKAGWLVKKHKGSKLNFNAIAQGYSVDLMGSILDSLQIKRYFIELGGEVKVRGKNKEGVFWRVGIDRPSGENLERELATIVSLEDQAMVTSGNYRKYIEIDGKKYYHTLDPKTGFPVQHKLLSATVIAEKAATADALATAFMVKGLEQSKKFLDKHSDYKSVLIFVNEEEKLETYYSPGLKDKIEEL